MKRLLSILALLLCAAPTLSQTLTFTLETTNPDGRSLVPRLTWSTTPAAGSCVASGAWVGTKLAAGTEILAAVTSAKSYTLNCTWPGSKTATVNWDAPTTNTDGTPLTDLASFKIFYGTTAAALTETGTAAATARTWQSPQLAVGTWFFAVRAVNTSGIESDNSNIAQKAITADATQSRTQTLGFLIPSPPTNVR
jgi:predicted phage tail protein